MTVSVTVSGTDLCAIPAPRCVLLLLLLVGCSDASLFREPPPPVASPPEQPEDGTGCPPDFNTCTPAYFAQYFNLSADHPDVAHAFDPDALPPEEDWWAAEGLAFQRTDPTLTFGEAWWPVDEGFAGDPSWFAVRWNAWLLADGDTDWDFALAARDDAEVRIDGELVAQVEAGDGYALDEHSARLDGGRHTLELRFAHRFGDGDGFFFRSLSGPDDVQVCPPSFE